MYNIPVIFCIILLLLLIFIILCLFIQTEQKIDVLKQKHILNSYNDIMMKDSFTNGNKNHVTASNTHFLRNPPVNILPKILPVNTNQKMTSKNTLKDNLSTTESTNSEIMKNILNNGNNIELHHSDISIKDHIPHCNNSLKVITMQEEKEKKVDDSKQVQSDISTNLITSKHSKFSRKSSEIVQELPQLRKTTPRLAKTRSAQNMKLMAQVLGPKGLSNNCNTLKSREKNELDKNSEKISALPKIVSKIIYFSKSK